MENEIVRNCGTCRFAVHMNPITNIGFCSNLQNRVNSDEKDLTVPIFSINYCQLWMFKPDQQKNDI